MSEATPCIITISRQLGSGGAYIGQQLAQKLGILYLDREIISQAAQKLSILEEEVESRDEKMPSFWETFFQLGVYNSPDVYIPPQMYIPSGEDLFSVESGIIERVAKERSAVIIGRCGSYILREHPGHASLFFYADNAFRTERVRSLYGITTEEAAKRVTLSDTERAKHHYMITGNEWTDARQYDLSINTGKYGLDACVEQILTFLDKA